MPKLINNRVNTEYYIVSYPATLGRHSSNTIGLLGSAISRFHAEIGFEGGQHYIEDLGSTYGTYVNERRITERSPLFDGDRIVLAKTSTRPDGEWDLTFSTMEIPYEDAADVRKSVEARPRVQDGTIFTGCTDGVLEVKMIGPIKNRECLQMLKRVAAELESQSCDVVLNLGAVTHMNSYALGSIAKLWADLREKGLDIALACAEGRALELLEMVGLTAHIGCHGSVEEAAAALRDRRRSR